MRHVPVAATALVLLAVAVPAAGQETPQHLDPAFHGRIDQAVVHGTVTPPGAPIHEKQKEKDAYEQLVWGYPELTEDELIGTYFKDGRFGEVEAAHVLAT